MNSIVGIETSGSNADLVCKAECCRNDIIYKDSYAERKRNADYITGLIAGLDGPDELSSVVVYPRDWKEVRGSEDKFNERELVIMSYRVFGFVLRSRKWGELPFICDH